jgi:hypothetical protein
MRGECERAAAAMAEVWDGGSAASAAADDEREEKGKGAVPGPADSTGMRLSLLQPRDTTAGDGCLQRGNPKYYICSLH